MKILIISSISPYKSSNHGKCYMDIFRKAGHQVHFLTKYKFDNMDDGMFSVYESTEPTLPSVNESFLHRCKEYITYKTLYIYYKFLSKGKNLTQSVIPISELSPVVDANLICEKITETYDAVFITFWQFMLNTHTIKAIYNKLKCPIFLFAVDMFPMTGGCYYFGDCKNYRNKCTKCPVAYLFENKKNPNQNFLYKKNVYNNTNCILLCNHWMKKKILESKIITENKVRESYGVLDPVYFQYYQKNKVREEVGVPLDKFIIFAGAANVNIRRKGIKELIDAVNKFESTIINKNVLLILAGNNVSNIQKRFAIPTIDAGFLSPEELIKMYRAANLYLSPSLDDAGPSMVVQSLASGTPVVAFDVGVASDIIVNRENGILAPLKDTETFAKGISYFYNLTEREREEKSEYCRISVKEKHSFEKFISNFEQLYEEFKSK